ncbi:MAG TPA: PqqD family protein [Blastocatellia bacterium]|nr:PqqD family protein [Blastocatellia bacterium]
MNTGPRKVVASEQASFTELLENQEGIILDLGNLHYYTLNPTAVFLWKQLQNKTTQTVETLSRSLARAFTISLGQAEAGTQAFLEELRQYGLVSYSALGGEDIPADIAESAVVSLPAYEVPQLRISQSLAQVALAQISSTISSG